MELSGPSSLRKSNLIKNSLTYRRDSDGMIHWDFSGLDSEEQTTEGFDEPDGDLSNLVCTRGSSISSATENDKPKLGNPLNLRTNTGNSLYLSKGNLESNQFVQVLFGKNDNIRIDNKSPVSAKQGQAIVPLGPPSRKVQYSPLTPPATPKKSPRNVTPSPGATSSPSNTSITDTSKFSFTDHGHNEHNPRWRTTSPSTEMSLYATSNVWKKYRRQSQTHQSPVPGHKQSKSPHGFDENENNLRCTGAVFGADDGCFRPLTLQDPPKPKQKKTVTWNDGQFVGENENSYGQMDRPAEERQVPICRDGEDYNEQADNFHEECFESVYEPILKPFANVERKLSGSLSPRKRPCDYRDNVFDASPPKQQSLTENLGTPNKSTRMQELLGSRFVQLNSGQKAFLNQEPTNPSETYSPVDMLKELNQLRAFVNQATLQHSRQQLRTSQNNDGLGTQSVFDNSPVSESPLLPNPVSASPFRVPISPAVGRKHSLSSTPSPKASPRAKPSQYFFPPDDINVRPTSVSHSFYHPSSSPKSPKLSPTSLSHLCHRPSPREHPSSPSMFSNPPTRQTHSSQSRQKLPFEDFRDNLHPANDFFDSQGNQDMSSLPESPSTSYPRNVAPPRNNPWTFPCNAMSCPSTDHGPSSSTRRRLFQPDNSTIDSQIDPSVREYLMKKNVSIEELSRLVNTKNQGDLFQARPQVPQSLRHVDYESEEQTQKRILRMRGHSMGEVEDRLFNKGPIQSPSYRRSHSQPIPHRTSNHISERRGNAQGGNIDIRVECDKVIDKNRQLGDDLIEMRSPASNKSCKCEEVEAQLLQMARDAYANIRRLDDSPEAFARFENEVHQTNNNITEALSILLALKRLCGHGRTIQYINNGSVIFTMNCPTIDSLRELLLWYDSGELQQLFQDSFVTETLLEAVKAKHIGLKVTICETDVRDCMSYFEEDPIADIEEQRPLVVRTLHTLHERFLDVVQRTNQQGGQDTQRENVSPESPHLGYYDSSGVRGQSEDVYRQRFCFNDQMQMVYGVAQEKSMRKSPHLGDMWFQPIKGDNPADLFDLISPTRKAFQELRYFP